MLILSRRTDEEIVIPSLDVRIRVLSVRGGRVRVGIEAPEHITIRREGERLQPVRSSERPQPSRQATTEITAG